MPRALSRSALGVLVVAALLLAWGNRFVQDDAFIAFSYARNLVEGTGLTWFGTRIEGYTNFLWVLWIAAGLALGQEPITWAYIGGLCAFAATLLLIPALGRGLFGQSGPGLLAAALFATNYSVSSYATGGLETMLQTALLTAALLLSWRIAHSARPRAGEAGLLSLALALAVMTRMDSAVPGFILGVAALIALVRRGAGPLVWVALSLPFLLLVGGWLLWKWSYYGHLLPNTFYAKVAPHEWISPNGLRYVWRFLHFYWLWPLLVVGVAVALLRRAALPRFPLTLPVLVLLAWLAYVVRVGGDFMEFRFLVPVAPVIFLLVAWAVVYPIGQGLLRRPVPAAVGALVLLGAGSWYYSRWFTGWTPDRTLDSIRTLATFYHTPNHTWSRFGDALRDQLAGQDVVLACDAVGAMPYYSRLRTIDLYGLNDAYVARHGVRLEYLWRKPGHVNFAPLPYLLEQRVNLVLLHLRTIPRGTLDQPGGIGLSQYLMRAMQAYTGERIEQATMVAIPIDDEYSLVGWYLHPHPRIEELIARGQWETHTLRVPPP